ncbi:hypothetical protein ABT120_55540 [Nonomuraea angiospora]|uniref:hypothetical protein n=1 Tax=Nonomuraea angiospora TaxID=46172 RepID=UPI00332526EB
MPTSPARPLLIGAMAMLVAASCSATTNAAGPGPAPAQSAAIPAQDGPGVTADTITISWGKGLLPTGTVPAATVKNFQEGYQAVVDAFNKQGGIGGRKIQILQDDPGKPLVAQRDEAYTKSNWLPVADPTNGKAACDAYANTQVFALLYPNLVSAPYGTPAAGACLNSGGHPIIGVNGWTKADYQAAPATAGVTIAADRFIDAVAAAGKDSGVLTKPAKTALITGSAQPGDLLDRLYLPALARAGVTGPQVFPVSQTLSDADKLSTTVKLKSAGIERIIFLTDAQATFSLALNLLPAFQKQQFEPQILSLDMPAHQALIAAAQIEFTPKLADNLVSYWTRPSRDTLKLTDAQAATPGGKLYNAVAKANPTLQPYLDLDLCDALELLKAALAASGSTHVNAQAFAAGLDKLNDSYQSPRLYATSFGPDRHDGGAGLVRQTYSAECKCGVPSAKVLGF